MTTQPFISQEELFGEPPIETFDLPGAELVLLNAVWSRSDGDLLCKRLIDELQWRQDKISMFGQSHDVPRLNAWYGDLIVPTVGRALRWIQFLGPQRYVKSKNAQRSGRR